MVSPALVLRDDPEWAPRAEAFAARVRDVSELLAEGEPRAARGPLPMSVAYHDACDLAHAQGVRAAGRPLPVVHPVELLDRSIRSAG